MTARYDQMTASREPGEIPDVPPLCARHRLGWTAFRPMVVKTSSGL